MLIQSCKILALQLTLQCIFFYKMAGEMEVLMFQMKLMFFSLQPYTQESTVFLVFNNNG